MKSIRILAVVLCCVLIFSFNVSADEEEIQLASYGLWYVATNDTPQGIIRKFDSGKPCDYVGWLAEFQIENNTTYLIRISFTDALTLSWQDPTIEKLAIYGSTNSVNYITDSEFDNANSNGIQYKDLVSSTTNIDGNNVTITFIMSTSSNEINNLIPGNYKTLCMYDANGYYGGGNITNFEIFATKNTINIEHQEIINKLTNIINNQNTLINQNTELYEQNNQLLQDIIDNQVIQNENWELLFNYGNNYNQIDQNIINGLGSAEDQLSNAEDAIQNKSQSLVNKVASQWSANKGVASSFLTTISPATTAIGTVTDNFFDAIPEEIKNAVITIMLIVFIGWLIGRVEG